MSCPAPCFVGVDVGTGSVRAGVFDPKGLLLGSSVCEISVHQPAPGHFEQSSDEIWGACCTTVHEASKAAGDVRIGGIAFDATCSLVLRRAGHSSLDLAPESDTEATNATHDIIMWCDHRATEEAREINSKGHRLLQFVGGKVFPEMEMPKLCWLRKYRPQIYAAATHFYDLTDYLAHRAADFRDGGGSGAGIRSQCTVVCKWNFDAAKRDWAPDFFEDAKVPDLRPSKIGTSVDVKAVGSAVAGGLGPLAASDLGLPEGITLGVGAIDAHAGGLGCLAAPCESWPPLEQCMALIAGTSACHMASSATELLVPGVWGPFDSAMLPGLFLHEAGQSAAGAALDFIMETHPAFPALQLEASKAGQKPADFLTTRILQQAKQRNMPPAFLSRGTFISPDFNGNRSPLADPALKGSIIGLGPAGDHKRATSIDALAILYLAALQGLAYSTRSIIETINAARAQIGSPGIAAVHVCGGLAQNTLYLQEHADALGLPLCCSDNPGADVLRGSAMLAAAACGAFPSVQAAMRGMAKPGRIWRPTEDEQLRRYHGARYEVLVHMQRHQQEYQALESHSFKRQKSSHD
ncbi:unnamed protein product [Effrenium voratum]|uniref:FGGY-family pentulose kinase n=1 Tax=Effrenium voratum TaxID=2562239 RepID=A0AA36JH27_9DINO|nr:unnamed protein product [Effrenium voratum]CAJ1440385.1 unnamed protein product [Effrenium voratum]